MIRRSIDILRNAGSRFLDTRLGRELQAYVCDRDGVVAIIFVVALIPIVASAGAAVDISRAYGVKQRLGQALDAAGLAVGSSVGDENELRIIMQRYFDANYPEDEVGVPATPSMVIDGSDITLTATADVDTTLMKVVGINEITVAATTTIIRETKGLEVVLVLDNTGSMAGSKIVALRDASRQFTEILFGEQAEAENLKVGVVPFTGSVNIGPGNRRPYTRGPDRANSDYEPDIWRGCVEARDLPRDTVDTFDTVRAERWRRYLYPSNSSNDWPGLSGSRGQFRGPNKQCPVELLPLNNVKQTVLNKIDQMEANGVTHINLGAVWGWRVLSPEEPFTEGIAYDDPEINKAIVIMTDGENFISSSSNQYSAYGSISEGRLGTTNVGAAVDELDRRLGLVCDNIKETGILVYTITFQVNSTSTRNLMRDCATDPSKYFNSPSNDELRRAFRAIAAELSNLRIGR